MWGFFRTFFFFFFPRLFGSIFFIAFFGRFVTREVKKRDKKNARKSPQLPKKVVTYSRRFFLFCFRGASWGPPKQIDGPPRTFAKSQTHPPADFFSKYVFGVSRQGAFKSAIKIFLQKVHVETFPKTTDRKNDISFSSTFFLSRFQVFFSDEFKNTTKNVLPKKSCRKGFTKNWTKNPKTDFSFLSISLITFLGVLGDGDFKNTIKISKKINSTLVLFWPLTHPLTTGVADSLFWWLLEGLAPHYLCPHARPSPGVGGGGGAVSKGIFFLGRGFHYWPGSAARPQKPWTRPSQAPRWILSPSPCRRPLSGMGPRFWGRAALLGRR
jgi:hypothetical protein